MFLFWDHGAGPAKGVCFDENSGFDSLTLIEIDTAFNNAELKTKLDIICFDACLMASVGTAYFMRDHANYLIASEEVVPGSGFDYKALAEEFSKGTDNIAFGKAVCDSFMAKCKNHNKAELSTLSLVDLNQIDGLISDLDWFAEILLGQAEFGEFTNILQAAKMCEKFGGENSFYDCANMIDFWNFIELTTDGMGMFDEGNLQNAVIYKVSGERTNCGLSMYYPLVRDNRELNEYIDFYISNKYNEYLLTYYINAPYRPIEFTDKGSIKGGAFTVSLTKIAANTLQA